jgi:hypothetical protein
VDLDHVVARLEIYDCLIRYCRGVDRGDPELVRSAYFKDGVDDHGAGPVDPEDFATSSVTRGDATGMIGQHLITNHTMSIRGSEARVESYWMAIHPDPPGMAWAGGRYLDRFERRDDHWRIAHRRVICDWSREPENRPPWAAAGVMPTGGRRDQDLVDGFLDFREEEPAPPL